MTEPAEQAASSPPVKVKEGAPLDDLMLAMDVVDTLRHRQQLVERELSADQREEALIERIRDIYAQQGIEVPEHIIAEGVAALREDRFVYAPPPMSLQVRLARLYVNRVAWFKRLAVLGVVALLLWGAWYLLVTRPAQQKLDFAIGEINGRIMLNDQQLDRAGDRAQVLEDDLAKALSDAASPELQRLLNAARSDLLDARRLIGEARTLDQSANINENNLESRGDQAKAQAQQQMVLADQADAELDQVAQALGSIGALAQLPGLLDAAQSRVLEVARVESARQQARELYQQGQAALRSGDVSAAQAQLNDLADLAEALESTYTLRIVSRPGVRSGVWRVPDSNRSARNYYLIVEAVDASGRALQLPITSEETGQTRRVNMWGLRVSERTFNGVRDDKSDDGIIQRDEVGTKQRGYLEPEYRMDTTGGAITDW